MAFAVFIFALFLKVSTALSSQNITHLFSAVFIFGDSTADSGNNNYINTPFKADHPPYGEDFPGKIPTGRFSTGKLMSDIWASLLGIKQTVPPFLQPNISDFDIRTGVNFASAGSGHDDMTTQISQVIPVTKQLYYFKEYIKRLKKVVGIKEANRIIEGALVSISGGTNDFTISYYDLPSRRDNFSMDDYQDYILKKLQNFINFV
ncbi:GDSL esterase/lipase At1g58430 [Lactuca sativa]|uniref:GDSL esterase/lipase At1g58430 n=1 Tax=Lactuca sativa TaxID=4236 RepID=UPI000CD944F9|nr:GDSL esterase/lipase At1g58430 [Lactuca sativa]